MFHFLFSDLLYLRPQKRLPSPFLGMPMAGPKAVYLQSPLVSARVEDSLRSSVLLKNRNKTEKPKSMPDSSTIYAHGIGRSESTAILLSSRCTAWEPLLFRVAITPRSITGLPGSGSSSEANGKWSMPIFHPWCSHNSLSHCLPPSPGVTFSKSTP